MDHQVAALQVQPCIDGPRFDAAAQAPAVLVPLEEFVIRNDGHTLCDETESGGEPADTEANAAPPLRIHARKDLGDPVPLRFLVAEQKHRTLGREFLKFIADGFRPAAEWRQAFSPKRERVRHTGRHETRQVQAREPARLLHHRLERVHADGARQVREKRAADLGDLQRLVPDNPGVRRQIIHQVRARRGRNGAPLPHPGRVRTDRNEGNRRPLPLFLAPLR